MDVTGARTFLAVVEYGSFVEAAARVHVTQSTVSMRIRALEHELGKPLFERSRAGATLTPAGTQFHKHALAIVRVWEQARLEVSLPEEFRTSLVVGGQVSLWDGFLLDWLTRMRRAAPEVAIRAQFGFSNPLLAHLIEGTLDLGVMYTPQVRPGFRVERIFTEELVLVSSVPRRGLRKGRNYVYVDWGPEFQADHSINFPDVRAPALYMELGSLCLNYVLANRTAAYFPRRIVAGHLEAGTLSVVGDAPVFSYPVYAVYSGDTEPELKRLILRTLKEEAARL